MSKRELNVSGSIVFKIWKLRQSLGQHAYIILWGNPATRGKNHGHHGDQTIILDCQNEKAARRAVKAASSQLQCKKEKKSTVRMNDIL